MTGFPLPSDLFFGEENYPFKVRNVVIKCQWLWERAEWSQGDAYRIPEVLLQVRHSRQLPSKEPVIHQTLLQCTLNRACRKLFCFEQFALFLPQCSPAPMMLLSLQQILKLCPKKKSSSTYTFCKSVGLLGMQFHLFENECKSTAPGFPGGVWQGKGEGRRGLCEFAVGERFCQS